MARRRGFFAELQHQAAVAERNRQRAAAADFRLHQQRQREVERLNNAARRAREQAGRADARTRAAAEKESQRLYAEARVAEAEAMTAEAEMKLQEIDDILVATLDVDDYVDLEALRAVAEHPRFESPHAAAIAAPAPIAPGPLPTYYPPSGTGPRKGKRAEDSARADRTFMLGLYAWWDALPAVERADQAQAEQHAQAERRRLDLLATDRAAYDQGCHTREADTRRRNEDLDDLIRGFGANEARALVEYFSIVLENSAYPDDVEVYCDLTVDAANGEMTVQVEIPAPADMPVNKAFKYTKARDEITAVAQTQAERKQRYAALLHNVALRTLHELWEADRTRKLQSISMTVSVAHLDPATGRDTTTPLVAVAVARDEFESLVLDRVDAGASLRYLGAVISRAPVALTPISTASGVRTR